MTGERDEGQAAVELALVLPLVVVLLLAVVQVALVARDQILVVHVARAGARQAAVDDDPAAVRRAVLDAAGGGLVPASVRVAVTPAPAGGDLVTVGVTYDAPTDLPLLGPLLPAVALRGQATMAREMSVSAVFSGGTEDSEQELVGPPANPPISTVRGQAPAKKVVSRGPA